MTVSQKQGKPPIYHLHCGHMVSSHRASMTFKRQGNTLLCPWCLTRQFILRIEHPKEDEDEQQKKKRRTKKRPNQKRRAADREGWTTTS